jgi:hypothetical protein
MFLCCLIFDKRTYCMKKFSTAIKYVLVGFTLFNSAIVFAAAGSECVIQPDGSCLKVEVETTRDTGGGMTGGSLGGGGGDGGEMGRGGGGGGSNEAKPDDKLIGELIMKLITEYKPPCQASNESSTAYAVRAQADCSVHVLGGITRAFPVLTGAIPMATIAGAANACRLLITVDLPSSGGAPICK